MLNEVHGMYGSKNRMEMQGTWVWRIGRSFLRLDSVNGSCQSLDVSAGDAGYGDTTIFRGVDRVLGDISISIKSR